MHDIFDISDHQNIEYNIHHNKNIVETRKKIYISLFRIDYLHLQTSSTLFIINYRIKISSIIKNTNVIVYLKKGKKEKSSQEFVFFFII
jgi:hypothetical protein